MILAVFFLIFAIQGCFGPKIKNTHSILFRNSQKILLLFNTLKYLVYNSYSMNLMIFCCLECLRLFFFYCFMDLYIFQYCEKCLSLNAKRFSKTLLKIFFHYELRYVIFQVSSQFEFSNFITNLLSSKFEFLTQFEFLTLVTI